MNIAKPTLTNEQYHKAPGLSSSNLKDLSKSINVWNMKRNGSKSMDLGTAFHDFILEDIDRTLVLPKVNKARKDHKDGEDGLIQLVQFMANKHGGLPDFDLSDMKMDVLRQYHDVLEYNLSFDYLVLNDKLGDALKRMKESFANHPEAKDYICKTIPHEVEQSYIIPAKEIFSTSLDLDIRIRPDYTNDSIGVDLKSTKCSDYRPFKYDMWKFGYHASLALYDRVLDVCGKKKEDWYIVAVENQEPFNTEIFRMSQQTLDEGWSIIQQGFTRYEQYVRGGAYTGYSIDGEILEL
jgi:hypothetical protein